MTKLNRMREDVHYFLQDLTYSIVAESGIATDRYHIGKLILQSLKNAPDFLMQIDGATGESDTFSSALERSVRCASGLQKLGVKPTDNVVIMGPNNIDLTMPLYACFYLGAAVVTIDMTLGANELQTTFVQCNPKVVFCQSGNASNVKQAVRSLKLDTHIITFGEVAKFTSFRKFLDKYSDNVVVDDFKPNDFDTRTTIALLAATSGSTGSPKVAALTHENIIIGFSDCLGMYSDFPTPLRLAIVPSLLQWMTAAYHFILSPILRYTRLQTSSTFTAEHGHYLITKYKPTFMITNPNLVTALLKNHENCDFSSFEHLILAGSVPSKTLLDKIKRVIPNAVVQAGYGTTEATGYIFDYVGVSLDSAGTPMRRFEYKLVDYATGEEIDAPNKPGELWVKGRSVFKGYYNQPEVNALTLTEDGWLKTGDILYRDENNVFFYVDRLKMLLKYHNHHISPIEIENVILSHPGVFEVAVTGVPDLEHGELPVAFVVPNEGFTLTANEIKDTVKNNLTDSKQLRGGVVFVDKLPKTTTGKLNRIGIKKLVLTEKRE